MTDRKDDTPPTLLDWLGLRALADAAGHNLGAGALIAALLGAPFLIWATVIKQTTLNFQKEGHITVRISKWWCS